MIPRPSTERRHDCVIRSYRRGDEAGMLELLRAVFPVYRDRSFGYWSWLNRDWLTGDIVPAVAEHDGRIVATDYFVPMALKLGNATIGGAYGVALAVHPDFRGLGLSGELMSQTGLSPDSCKLAYYASGNPTAIKISGRRGTRAFPCPVHAWLAIRDLSLHWRRQTRKAGRLDTARYVLRRAAVGFRRAGRSVPDLHIAEIGHFDERADAFWEQIRGGYDFIVERRRQYLNWRYADRRGGVHTIKHATQAGRTVGYCVWCVDSVRDADYPLGSIVDLLVLPDRLDVADALVIDAMRWFSENRINVVRFLAVAGHPYEKILSRHGFVRWERAGLFYREIAPGTANAVESLAQSPPGAVHVCYGDLP
jgi:GNAT superfamily N-acetyltransferase